MQFLNICKAPVSCGIYCLFLSRTTRKRKRVRSMKRIGSIVKAEVTEESDCCGRQMKQIYRRLDSLLLIKHVVSAPLSNFFSKRENWMDADSICYLVRLIPQDIIYPFLPCHNPVWLFGENLLKYSVTLKECKRTKMNRVRGD